jgi:regulator of protease activity HflC (stomatin/prohibitin superfamily)
VVGVVRTFGSITGLVGEGFQVTWPWQSVETWNIPTQVIEPDTRCSNGTLKCMDAASVDVQDVYLNGTLNISVDTRDVQQLARNIGPSYRETIVLNRLNQVVKETTAKYKAEDILSAREEIRNSVRDRMITEMADYSIRVDDFLITNIDFTDAFKKAIEDKVIVAQQAQAEQNRVAIARAQAEQRAETALGEANRLRIEAQGQADANREISSSLTPQLIQFQAVQKLSDKIQIALIPSGQGIIIDPATLLQPR